jgi:hypothetical protein
MKYAKIFDSIWEGSMRGKSDPLFVFVNLLTHSDEYGVVDRHWQAIADETGLSEDRIKTAIEYLESPDPESRTTLEDGRRIKRLDVHRSWGWQIVNHAKYRELCTKAQNAERVRKYRGKHKCNADVMVCNILPVGVGVGVGVDKSSLSWRDSLEVYQTQEKESFVKLCEDATWIAERERLNPRLDVRLSLEKAHIEFWSTEAGWKHKKKSKIQDIDWKSTYTKALGLSGNRVWKDTRNTSQAIAQTTPPDPLILDYAKQAFTMIKQKQQVGQFYHSIADKIGADKLAKVKREVERMLNNKGEI